MRETGRIHLAIIMDGNGRWARRRGRPRTAGHVAGARAVREVVEAAAASPEIGTLTLYAFSSDNWARPAREVAGLMRLLGRYLQTETARCVANGIRLEVIGRRDRLPPRLVARIRAAERATAGALGSDASPGTGDPMTRRPPALVLRLAIDYSARDAIVRAAMAAGGAAGGAAGTAAGAPVPARSGSGDGGDGGVALEREAFARLLAAASSPGVPGASSPAPDVDLLVRTGGERRLSDFLLWECAYAELWFTPVLWPDFGAAELAAALAEYGRRDRRFGRVLEEAS